MFRPFATALGSVLAASLACGSAAALEAVAGTQLVMHVGPSAEHRSLATIPADTHLTVNGCSEAEGWCLVRYDGRHGWIEGESLDVIGFSRPAPQPAAPPPPEKIVVPVPVVTDVPVHGYVTADDVVIGIDEQTGLAATFPRTSKLVDRGKRKGSGLTFKRHGFKHGGHVRRHGTFRHGHFAKHGVHAGKKAGVDRRLTFRKAGHRFGKPVRSGRLHLGKERGSFGRGHLGKDLKFDRLRFGKPGRFFGHRSDGGARFGKAHLKKRFGKRGKALGRSGKARFGGGLRIKGGWRP